MSKSITLVALLMFLLPTQFLSAQKNQSDGPVGIFNSDAEYVEFIGSAKQLAYGPDGSPELRAMIPMLNDIALAQPLGTTAGEYNAEGSTLGMLSDEKIRDELEMVDEQYEDLVKLNEEIQSRMAKEIRGLDLSNPDGLADRIRAMQAQAQKDLESVLLPHQVTRLQQISLQSQSRRRTLVDLITSDPLKTSLEITDEQTDDLKAAEKEIEEELARDIAELRKKAREKLLSNLKRKQRDQVNELFGEAFKFSDGGQSKNEGRKGKSGQRNKRPGKSK